MRLFQAEMQRKVWKKEKRKVHILVLFLTLPFETLFPSLWLCHLYGWLTRPDKIRTLAMGPPGCPVWSGGQSCHVRRRLPPQEQHLFASPRPQSLVQSRRCLAEYALW